MQQGLTRFTPSPGNVLQDITNHAGTDSHNSHNGSPVWAVTSVERSEFPPRKEPCLPSYHTSELTACSEERVATAQDTKDESADGPEAISLVMKQSAFSSFSPTTGFVGA